MSGSLADRFRLVPLESFSLTVSDFSTPLRFATLTRPMVTPRLVVLARRLSVGDGVNVNDKNSGVVVTPESDLARSDGSPPDLGFHLRQSRDRLTENPRREVRGGRVPSVPKLLGAPDRDPPRIRSERTREVRGGQGGTRRQFLPDEMDQSRLRSRVPLHLPRSERPLPVESRQRRGRTPR